MHIPTLIFLTALATGLLLQLWLYHRQARHVTAHRGTVPAAFAQRIPLPDHQRAADYTLGKIRLGTLDLLLGTLVLLGWTLGGGLSLVLDAWDGLRIGLLWGGALAILSVLLIGAIIELPLSIWRTFVLEQRFGFNRTPT
jgi:STE24 endopeptidase